MLILCCGCCCALSLRSSLPHIRNIALRRGDAGDLAELRRWGADTPALLIKYSNHVLDKTVKVIALRDR